MAEQHNHFHLGQKIDDHPFVAGDGAVLELFRQDMTNTAFVGLSNITEDEQHILANSSVEIGLFSSDNRGCLIVLKLGEMAFDIQFNAAMIPSEFFVQPDLANGTFKLNLMVLDTESNELKVLRELAVPESLANQFITVTNQQRLVQDPMDVNVENMHLLNTLNTAQLLQKIELTRVQSVISPSCSCGHDHHHSH